MGKRPCVIPHCGDSSDATLGVPSEALLHPRGLFSPLVGQKKDAFLRLCVPREARTLDPLIKSQLLYQLS